MARRVSIDAVWDDTTRTLAARGARLVPIALVAFVLPAVVQAAIRLFPVTGPARAAMLALLVSVAGLVLALWGALAVIALATDPAPTSAVARTGATRRLPASMGVTAVLGAGALLLSLPVGFAAVIGGLDLSAMSNGTVPAMPAGGSGLIVASTLLVIVLFLWLSARLLPTQAVVLHQRRGLGAIGAAFSSTRGSAPRLVVAEVVFALVVLVATYAVQSAVGTVLLVTVGGTWMAGALFLTALATALVSATFTCVAWVFVARLHAALAGGSRPGAGTPGTA